MKQICIILSICFAMALTGCDSKEFNNTIKEGDTALANKDYITAESSFRLALSKKNDPDAFKLTNKISNIIKIQQYQKDKNYDNALSLCKELEREGFINDLIKNDIMNLKKNIEKDKSKFDEQQKEQTNQVSTVKEKDSNSKNTFEVLEMSPMGEIYSISTNKQVPSSSNEPYKYLVYNDCAIDFIHGHDDEGKWTPWNQNKERTYNNCKN